MNVLITGASGLVATELILNLLDSTDYELLLVTRDKKKLEERYEDNLNRIKVLTLEELATEKSCRFDVCVHTAFSRSSDGGQIASSLLFLQQLCKICTEQKVATFINISSQSVYGNDYTPGTAEDGVCAPSYMYALGKYSSELICEEAFCRTSTKVYNIRLSSVCENARFVRIFVENALKCMPITLTAPQQTVSFIDVRDVANALSLLIKSRNAQSGIYNLGTGEWYTIRKVADTVKRIGEKKYGVSNVEIIENDNGTLTQIGMNVDKIKSTLDWTPEFTLDDMIISLFEMLTSVNGGGIHEPLSWSILYEQNSASN